MQNEFKRNRSTLTIGTNPRNATASPTLANYVVNMFIVMISLKILHSSPLVANLIGLHYFAGM